MTSAPSLVLANSLMRGVSKPLFPISPVIMDARAYETYPSVAGHFLVYSRLGHGTFSVIQTSAAEPATEGRSIVPKQPNEALRFGAALRDGAVGYVSNRMGPVSAWMRQARGEGHLLIGNMGTFNGALVPMNLHASPDGRIWCFDTTLEKTQRSRMLSEFADATMDKELLGQTWRFYSSDAFQHKLGYRATKTGNASRFQPPSLFVFDRVHGQLTLIPNAFDAAVSPAGKRIVFVRSINGNYDLWMQDISGGGLTQLTTTPFGEFEPSWSPDGKKIAFISNRASRGDVRATSIYVINLSTGRTTRLTNARTATDGGPAWKDAHTILFHSNRSPSRPQTSTVSDWNIWQVNIQGDF